MKNGSFLLYFANKCVRKTNIDSLNFLVVNPNSIADFVNFIPAKSNFKISFTLFGS